MKKTILAMTFGGLALMAIGNLMGECKAHKKYNKGWNDGVKFGIALKDLEHTLVEILDNHKEEES